MFCLSHYCWLNFLSGRSLHFLEADCHRYLESAKQLNRINGVFFLSPLTKLIAALTDSGLGIETYLDGKSADLFTDHLVLVDAIWNAYLGKYQIAADLYFGQCGHYDSTYPAMHVGMWAKFIAGVCAYDVATNTGRAKYRKLANKVRATVHSWVKNGNPNANHYACLLDAEYYRMKGNFAEACKFYENASIMAGRIGLLHDAALVHERYAIHLLNSVSRAEEEAIFRLKKAVKLYSEWGAVGKVRLLHEKHGDLLRAASSVFGKSTHI